MWVISYHHHNFSFMLLISFSSGSTLVRSILALPPMYFRNPSGMSIDPSWFYIYTIFNKYALYINLSAFYLKILDNRNQHSGHRARRPVDGVRIVDAAVGVAELNLEASRLVVGAVAATGDLAVHLTAGQPSFDVVFAIGVILKIIYVIDEFCVARIFTDTPERPVQRAACPAAESATPTLGTVQFRCP